MLSMGLTGPDAKSFIFYDHLSGGLTPLLM